MDWREFFGISKPLSEKELLEMEIIQICKTKNQILIYGYDEKFIENEVCLSALEVAAENGIKIGVILHERDPPNKLESLVNKFKNVEVNRSNNRFLINNGFRAYDKHFGVSYNKNKKSRYLPERGVVFYRDYLDDFNNLFLRRTYRGELSHIQK